VTYEVDLDELRSTLAELAACQRDLVGIAAEIDHARGRLSDRWSGRAADAQALSYDWWRDGRADMVTARRAAGGRHRGGGLVLRAPPGRTSRSGQVSA
jgi:uncharacterized protein YukE